MSICKFICHNFIIWNTSYLSFSLDIWLIMQAAEETGRRLKVYAVEKNPNAVVTLHVSSNCPQ